MKKLLLSAAASATIVILPAAQAYAWTYALSGSGVCQPNGSYKITWVVDNSHENQDMKVTYSSNPSVIAVGAKVPAYKTVSFAQVADGTKAATFNLTLKGNWPSDQTQQSHTASVNLYKACAQPTPPATPPVTPPTPPIEGGRGAGKVTASPVATPVASSSTPTAQVVAPVGSVNAGENPKSISYVSLAGLVTSIGATGFGALKLRKNR
jgi:hypothetical protein